MCNGPLAGEDLDLLKKISVGDEEAFRQLYDLTHQKVVFLFKTNPSGYCLMKGWGFLVFLFLVFLDFSSED